MAATEILADAAQPEQDYSLDFSRSETLTLGVELELQIVSRLDGDLTRGATELLALIERKQHHGDFKPEITESMIEVSTSVHHNCATMSAELTDVRRTLIQAADQLNLLICGGGAHPFQHWAERKIFDKPRFHHLHEQYGYLAKQFTVFGQHIHVGCPNGDEALFLLHALSRYLPHFIALSAASPYYQGVDTAFDSSRLNAVSAFPLSGRAPLVRKWSEFIAYFEHMRGFGVVESMKDFYWDIRPKPEFGTVEIRICDTPLDIERAVALAAFSQAVCRYLLIERPFVIDESLYAVYTFNRFQAARFGFDGSFIDPTTREKKVLRDDFIETLQKLAPHSAELDVTALLLGLEKVAREGNDAFWMREAYAPTRSFGDLVWQVAQRWRGNN
ncbi:YbdK family carboxylate-amine ligase [Uliginosibacterium sp. H1]|uniref:YbdK family carboxylate-amine ligase n=1 Tax=Uliginosibacterium sp. H1 TaxID=3114757 RepID=UPI002E197736|nr:YbdK family carboxylate-amine ligase [Uliginosibacterium sp. H1]